MKRLVEYSSDDEPTCARNKKSKEETKLPSLPTHFQDLFLSGPRLTDDPEFHQGRIRTHQHVEGQWPSHVYIEWYPDDSGCGEILKKLLDLADKAIGAKLTGKEMHSLLESELNVKLPLHISLSNTMMIETENKDEFLAGIMDSMKNFECFEVEIVTHSVNILLNDTKTRAFIAIQIKNGYSKVS
jgi:hypothetical protein